MSQVILTDELFIRDAASRIRLRMSRTAQDIVDIGRDLIAVKERLGHGKFLPWIDGEFHMSDQSASNFMNVARHYGDQIPNGLEFEPAVLYALAAPSTPEEVREAVADKAAAGESVTVAEVKQLKQQIKERDDTVKKLKSEKRASDDHNTKLVRDVQTKAAEAISLGARIVDLQEEIRRTSEAGTITMVPNYDPVKVALLNLWEAAPPEVRTWFASQIAA